MASTPRSPRRKKTAVEVSEKWTDKAYGALVDMATFYKDQGKNVKWELVRKEFQRRGYSSSAKQVRRVFLKTKSIPQNYIRRLKLNLFGLASIQISQKYQNLIKKKRWAEFCKEYWNAVLEKRTAKSLQRNAQLARDVEGAESDDDSTSSGSGSSASSSGSSESDSDDSDDSSSSPAAKSASV